MIRPEEKLKGTLGGVVLWDFAKDRLCNPVDAVGRLCEVGVEQEIGSNQNMDQPQNVRLRLKMILNDGDT